MKLEYENKLSNFAFSCNTRHYAAVLATGAVFHGILKLPLADSSCIAAVMDGAVTLTAASDTVAVGLGRKCSKCPSTHFKPSVLELNSII